MNQNKSIQKVKQTNSTLKMDKSQNTRLQGKKITQKQPKSKVIKQGQKITPLLFITSEEDAGIFNQLSPAHVNEIIKGNSSPQNDQNIPDLSKFRSNKCNSILKDTKESILLTKRFKSASLSSVDNDNSHADRLRELIEKSKESLPKGDIFDYFKKENFIVDSMDRVMKEISENLDYLTNEELSNARNKEQLDIMLWANQIVYEIDMINVECVNNQESLEDFMRGHFLDYGEDYLESDFLEAHKTRLLSYDETFKSSIDNLESAVEILNKIEKDFERNKKKEKLLEIKQFRRQAMTPNKKVTLENVVKYRKKASRKISKKLLNLDSYDQLETSSIKLNEYIDELKPIKCNLIRDDSENVKETIEKAASEYQSEGQAFQSDLDSNNNSKTFNNSNDDDDIIDYDQIDFNLIQARKLRKNTNNSNKFNSDEKGLVNVRAEEKRISEKIDKSPGLNSKVKAKQIIVPKLRKVYKESFSNVISKTEKDDSRILNESDDIIIPFSTKNLNNDRGKKKPVPGLNTKSIINYFDNLKESVKNYTLGKKAK